MQAKLVVFKPDTSRVDVPLKAGEYLLGRSPSAKLRIPLPNVSRKHCQLTVSGEGIRIKDLGSSNGTYRNELRLSPGDEVPVNAGDVLGVGGCTIAVQIDGEPAEIETPRGMHQASSAPGGAATVSTTAVVASGSSGPGGDDFDGDETEDLDETIARAGPPSLSELGGSSAFDLDLDFDVDDKNPKL